MNMLFVSVTPDVSHPVRFISRIELHRLNMLDMFVTVATSSGDRSMLVNEMQFVNMLLKFVFAAKEVVGS